MVRGTVPLALEVSRRRGKIRAPRRIPEPSTTRADAGPRAARPLDACRRPVPVPGRVRSVTDPTVPLEPTLDGTDVPTSRPVELRQRAEARLARTAEALDRARADGRSAVDRGVPGTARSAPHRGPRPERPRQLPVPVHPDETTRAAGREVSEAADRFFNVLPRQLGDLPIAPPRLTSADDPPHTSRCQRCSARCGGRGREGPGEPDPTARAQQRDRSGLERIHGDVAELPSVDRAGGPASLAGLPEDYDRPIRPRPTGRPGDDRLSGFPTGHGLL